MRSLPSRALEALLRGAGFLALLLGPAASGAALLCDDSNNRIATETSFPPLLPTPTLVTDLSEPDGDRRFEFSHGTNRYLDAAGFQSESYRFQLEVPAGWGDERTSDPPLPLMVVMHGGCGDVEDFVEQMSWPNTGNADPRHDFAVLYVEDPVTAKFPQIAPTCTATGVIHHVGYFSHLNPVDAPDAPLGEIFVDYTTRRYELEIQWVVENFAIDVDQMGVVGHSKGGAGAMYYAFAHPTEISVAYMDVPRPHLAVKDETLTPCHVDALASDPPGYQGWLQRLDGATICEQEPGCSELYKRSQSGRDDRAAWWSYFHGLTRGGHEQGGPPTRTWVERLLDLRGTLRLDWDESGHDRCRAFWTCHVAQFASGADPVLGGRWSDSGWDPWMRGFLRLDLSYPAFSGSSIDDHPGGLVERPGASRMGEPGCAKDSAAKGDTECLNELDPGDLAGSLNRFLRWDGDSIRDTAGEWSVTLWIADDAASTGISGTICDETLPLWDPSYPSCFDDYASHGCGDVPGGPGCVPRSGLEMVDVTPIRIQSFAIGPGQEVPWRLRDGLEVLAQGEVTADAEGFVTVPVEISTSPRELSLPEPGALPSLVAGALALALLRRLRKRGPGHGREWNENEKRRTVWGSGVASGRVRAVSRKP